MIPDESGVTHREVLEGQLKRKNLSKQKREEIEAELAGPALPEGTEHIWRTFGRLHSRRGSNGFAPSPIGWVDIEAFMRVSRFPLTPWEIECIEELDHKYLSITAEATKKNTPPPKK